ncbi:MAG TPA: DMT family transporter [Bacilli bacterium]|nr:DMT family transporter [Bacilli bacterium]
MVKRINRAKYASLFALFAALFYGISIPVSKLLLGNLSPYLLSSLLYFGAGFGMLFIVTVSKQQSYNRVWTFQAKDMKYIVLMILLDIIAPIVLMIGLLQTTASTASLLNNLEIVFTSVIAMMFFKEMIGKKMWIAILFIIVAGTLLSFDDLSTIHFSIGSLFIVLAALSWGFENNCTRMLSHHNPIHVVVIKGLGSGLGALLIALFLKEVNSTWYYIIFGLVLGFVSYGLSLYFYIGAQRTLGASRTSAFYATAPFVGALLSVVFLKETITWIFVVSFLIMLSGTYLVLLEQKKQ